MKEIQDRLSEVYPNDVQKAVYRLVDKNELIKSGGNRNRAYLIPKKNK